MKNRIIIIPLFGLFFVNMSCKKFLQVDPPNSKIPAGLVFADDVSANSAVVGIYLAMYSSSFADGGITSLASLFGLSADELQNNSQVDVAMNFFETNNLEADNIYVDNLWTSLYKTIYQANAALEGLNNSTGVTPAQKSQLRGEALFIRGFCHFYLVNIFGDVPLVLTTDYKVNAMLPRTVKSEVYSGIEKDLLEADSLLTENYLSSLRIRPNRSVADAMLARFYLYKSDWPKANLFATKVINKIGIYSLPSDLNSVFLFNSAEAIWQLKPNDNAYYTNEGYAFGLVAGPQNNVLTDTLVHSFHNNDKRRVNWITSGGVFYLPSKYKLHEITGSSSTEYSMVFRLAEQFLIRAEARAQLGIISGENSAISDANIVRYRAGLSDTTATGLNEMMGIIERERKLELFTEWGHRWLDLKRWNKATDVLSSLKPTWNPTDALYPIPQREINQNPYLRPQNAGY